jgi:hypothetical protein
MPSTELFTKIRPFPSPTSIGRGTPREVRDGAVEIEGQAEILRQQVHGAERQEAKRRPAPDQGGGRAGDRAVAAGHHSRVDPRLGHRGRDPCRQGGSPVGRVQSLDSGCDDPLSDCFRHRTADAAGFCVDHQGDAQGCPGPGGVSGPFARAARRPRVGGVSFDDPPPIAANPSTALTRLT